MSRFCRCAMSDQSEDFRKPVTVTLPAHHWVAVLAVLEGGLRQKIMPQWEALKKGGVKADDLSAEQRAALTAPIFARAALVKALYEAGVMTAEANLQFGTQALDAIMKRFQNEKGDTRP